MDVSHKMLKTVPIMASSHKWIGEAMKHIKKGALTKTAKHAGMKPLQFAKEVVEHPEHHTETTRKRAQFLVNIQHK
jgi:hypothetical protein